MFGKKGALELSINAIVVLILAITILGLGIAFIRGQWTTLGGVFDKASQDVIDQLTQKVKDSGKLIALPSNSMSVQNGKKERFWIGVMNSGQKKRCYVTAVKCNSAMYSTDPNSPCGNADTAFVGGPSKMQINPATRWMTTNPPTLIAPNDVAVIPMDIQASTSQDTYSMTILVAAQKISDETSDPTCPTDVNAEMFSTDPANPSPDWSITKEDFSLDVK